MTLDDINAAQTLLGEGPFGPDAEDCERFASRYGHWLLKVARDRLALRDTLEQLAAFDDADKRSEEPEDRAYHAGRAAGLRMAVGYLR